MSNRDAREDICHDTVMRIHETLKFHGLDPDSVEDIDGPSIGFSLAEILSMHVRQLHDIGACRMEEWVKSKESGSDQLSYPDLCSWLDQHASKLTREYSMDESGGQYIWIVEFGNPPRYTQGDTIREVVTRAEEMRPLHPMIAP